MINVNVIYIFILWAIMIYNINPLVGICIGCEYAYITPSEVLRLWDLGCLSCTIGCTSRATLKISARWLNITIYQILCQRWFWEMLLFRRFLELFLLLQFWNHLWNRMVYIVTFNRLAGITYVALLVRPMVHFRNNYTY